MFRVYSPINGGGPEAAATTLLPRALSAQRLEDKGVVDGDDDGPKDQQGAPALRHYAERFCIYRAVSRSIQRLWIPWQHTVGSLLAHTHTHTM